MTTVAISALKGGTGKSSITVLVGNALAAAERRVLLIDLDHQQNLSQYHLPDPAYRLKRNIARALYTGDLVGNIAPSHIRNTDIVSGSFDILQLRAMSTRLLARLVQEINGSYDAVLIDCPPTLDAIVLSAWNAADRILTPARLDSFDYEGLDFLRRSLELESPDRIESWSIVLNFFRAARQDAQQSLEIQFDQAFAASYHNILPTRVPLSTAIHRAIHNGESISQAVAKKRVFDAVNELASWVMGTTVDLEGRSF
jgi:chromosome partitioning protein